MSAAMCPKCSRAQSHREHCCLASASAELQEARALIAQQAHRIEALENEVEILEALRVDVIRQAEAEGVILW